MSHYFENDKNLKSEIKELSYKHNSSFFMFYSDNGVFSKNGIDFGSKLLLETYLKEENITNKNTIIITKQGNEPTKIAEISKEELNENINEIAENYSKLGADIIEI